jgi:DNA-binding CsgD family transcriptional regulator
VAITAFERAARLTNSSARQGKWLILAAAYAAEYDSDLSRRLFRAAEPLDLEPQDREELVIRLEGLEEGSWTGSIKARSFVEMAEQARLDGEIDRARRLLWSVALRCFWSNPDRETRILIAQAIERLPNEELLPEHIAILATAAPIEYGQVVIERLSRLGAREMDAVSCWLLGIAATAVGAFEYAARRLGPATSALRSQGRLGLLSQALVSQTLATRYTGAWDIAIPAAAEATKLAQETKTQLWGAAAQALGAAIDGLRGATDRAESSAVDAERTIRVASAAPMLSLTQLARGATSLTAGRYAEAFAHLWRVFDPADIAYHPVVRAWGIGDLVEAATRSNHHEHAQAALQEMEWLATQAQFPALVAGLSYARPFVAPEDEAEALFLAGLSADFGSLALAHERLQLAYGIWLRRQHRPLESRAPLRAARDGFDAIGANPWAERARRELRASGETSGRRAQGGRELLTPQELQIALLAAEGLSNRDIGQRLYLSHRTIGFHLYRIFPKLNVTSRAELSAALHAGYGA